MSYLILIPSILNSWTQDCLASLSPLVGPHDVEIVDNSQLNRGVASSWNIGVDRVLAEKRDWLILCSAAVRFGPAGGCDFLNAVDEQYAAHAVEADGGLGWHLIAFSRITLERTGRFDENLYPAYEEDLDYSRRMQLAFGGRDVLRWPKVDVDARLAGVAHGIQEAHVYVDFVGLERYMARKWNGHKDGWDQQGFVKPFDDPQHDWRWWPTPPDPRCFIPAGRPAGVSWGRP